MLGERGAADAVAALRASGVDAEQLAQMGGMSELSQMTPSQIMAMRAQLQELFSAQTDESVNWKIGKDLALQQARSAGDPVVTAAQAEEIRQALTVADLWLDTCTDFLPAPGPREAWSRTDWVERTLPVWKEVCAPVATAATEALTSALINQINEMPAQMGEQTLQLGAIGSLMRMMAGTAFALQLGQAIGQLATESVSSTDVGLPLCNQPGTALVPANVEAFAAGLDVPEAEVRMFLSVREAATARLYAHVPWLRGQVMAAVDAYAREIRIDHHAVEEAVAQVDPNDPEALQQALRSGMFAPQETPAQKEALTRLETLLAVVEGWVEVVTFQAVVAQLPHAPQLQEMVRRRRAQGGPAEQVFARLIGLAFRPRRARDAAMLWGLLSTQVECSERDAFWSHPDVAPGPQDLDFPGDFLELRRAAQDRDSQVDADLASLLDGTLGYEGEAEAH
ncbi:zinc-dependent metalloprotease [Actinomyces trachealis]|uniref:zinc-dependent metalloprotease n=1 Tax=Actinomyces trachealis TaxID=2763540 RepID=UPI0018929632|nr:zinc-dependent metalloprotease [Actinomyces trachealis]